MTHLFDEIRRYERRKAIVRLLGPELIRRKDVTVCYESRPKHRKCGFYGQLSSSMIWSSHPIALIWIFMLSSTLDFTFASLTSWPMNAPCVLSNSYGRIACHIFNKTDGRKGIMLGTAHMNAKDVVPGRRSTWYNADCEQGQPMFVDAGFTGWGVHTQVS